MDFEIYCRSTSASLIRRAQENPRDADVRFFLGLKLSDEGKFVEAADALKVALEINPEHGSAAFYLVQAYLELGDDAEAEAILLKPYYWGENLAKRFLYLGQICSRSGRLEAARDWFFNALDLNTLRGPEIHLELTKLLELGVHMNVPDARFALVDERLALTAGCGELYARLRIFYDMSDASGLVVVLTSEFDDQEKNRIGPSVTNGAELFIQSLLDEPRFGLKNTPVTWVLMHEASALGMDPMHIVRVSFQAREVECQRTWFQRVCDHLCERKPKTYSVVENLSFHDIDHEQLEDLTRHRFFWV